MDRGGGVPLCLFYADVSHDSPAKTTHLIPRRPWGLIVESAREENFYIDTLHVVKSNPFFPS